MSAPLESSITRKAHLDLVSERGYFIYGAGGHASVVEDFFPENTLLACVTDDWDSEHMLLWKEIVYGPHEVPPKSKVIVAIGDNKSRERVVVRLQSTEKDLIFPNVHHPSAQLSHRTIIGEGIVRCANSVVVAGSYLGDFVIINTGATIDHDCSIGDFSHIAPGVNLCGGVTVGSHTLVGVGSCAVPKVSIGSHTIIGAGSVIVNDIPDGVVAYGNPCTVIRENR